MNSQIQSSSNILPPIPEAPLPECYCCRKDLTVDQFDPSRKTYELLVGWVDGTYVRIHDTCEPVYRKLFEQYRGIYDQRKLEEARVARIEQQADRMEQGQEELDVPAQVEEPYRLRDGICTPLVKKITAAGCALFSIVGTLTALAYRDSL